MPEALGDALFYCVCGLAKPLIFLIFIRILRYSYIQNCKCNYLQIAFCILLQKKHPLQIHEATTENRPCKKNRGFFLPYMSITMDL